VSLNASGAVRVADVSMLDFDKNGGLLPAIVQDATSGAVLMLGYMDREALEKTLACQRVTFFSRSRQRLWTKGETSGAFLDLVSVTPDCDRDALLVMARPQGAVCHRGTSTCFDVTSNEKHPSAQTSSESLAFLNALETIIEQRSGLQAPDSYTARLFAQGPRRLAQKVGEEAVEVALASLTEADSRVVEESADLLFHLLVLLRGRGLKLHRVLDEMRRRHAERTNQPLTR